MTFRNWRIRHPTLRNVKGLTFVAVVFWVVSILAGCSEQTPQAAEDDLPEQRAGEPQQIDQAIDSPFEAPATASYAPSLGSPGLNEKVFDAAVIARVRLMDTEATAEQVGTNEDGEELYRGLLNFRFEVLEYLKGTGGDELVVSAHIDIGSKEIKHIMDTTARGEPVNWRAVDRTNPYTTMELALQAAKLWEQERDTRWDELEAIIFAKDVGASSSPDGSRPYSFGALFHYAIDGTYRAWLPSAGEASVTDTADGASSDGTRFFLEVLPLDGVSPREASEAVAAQPATISVFEMRALIAKMEQWRRKSEKDEGYLNCIRASFYEEALINGKKERGESLNTSFDYYLDSGLLARTVLNESGSPRPGRTWLGGEDKDLFADENGPFITKRPLPAGKYLVYRNYQWPQLVPCDYYPDEYRDVHATYVHVTAPDGTVHEAFFDPVTDGAAVGADASNGVLEPASFEDEGGTSTIDRIAWESQQVRMEFSASAPPSGHHVDFIALDGTVALRLKIDDGTVTVDGDGTALSWGVCSQHWEAGDKLMLRISESPPDLSGATNDTECPSSGP